MAQGNKLYYNISIILKNHGPVPESFTSPMGTQTNTKLIAVYDPRVQRLKVRIFQISKITHQFRKNNGHPYIRYD